MATLLSTLGLDDFGSVSESVRDAVLAYHVSNSEYLSAALVNNLEIATLQGEPIKVVTTTTGEKTLDTGATSDSKVTSTDIRATNGVIHVVDVVLVPPTIGALIVETIGTVAQPLLLGADFTILAAGILKANSFATTNGLPTLTDILINATPGTENFVYTVFAPTNGTFNAGSITVDSFTGQQWYGIISHHIVASDVTYGAATDFEPGSTFTTLASLQTGKVLTVLSKDAPTQPDLGITTGIVLDSDGNAADGPEAQIAVLDVLTATGANPAENGIINVVAGVLAPQ
jgi:transforming growth factor-beta-induced protein